MYVDVCQVTSAVSDSATQWTVAHQVSLSIGFSRQEYWSGLPLSTPGDLPNTGMESSLSHLPHCQVSSLPLAPPGNYNSDRKLIQESWPSFSKWKINHKYLLLLFSETIVEGFSKHRRVKRSGKESVKRTP